MQVYSPAVNRVDEVPLPRLEKVENSCARAEPLADSISTRATVTERKAIGSEKVLICTIDVYRRRDARCMMRAPEVIVAEVL